MKTLIWPRVNNRRTPSPPRSADGGETTWPLYGSKPTVLLSITRALVPRVQSGTVLHLPAAPWHRWASCHSAFRPPPPLDDEQRVARPHAAAPRASRLAQRLERQPQRVSSRSDRRPRGQEATARGRAGGSSGRGAARGRLAAALGQRRAALGHGTLLPGLVEPNRSRM